jgi:hypothetical protein
MLVHPHSISSSIRVLNKDEMAHIPMRSPQDEQLVMLRSFGGHFGQADPVILSNSNERIVMNQSSLQSSHSCSGYFLARPATGPSEAAR